MECRIQPDELTALNSRYQNIPLFITTALVISINPMTGSVSLTKVQTGLTAKYGNIAVRAVASNAGEIVVSWDAECPRLRTLPRRIRQHGCRFPSRQSELNGRMDRALSSMLTGMRQNIPVSSVRAAVQHSPAVSGRSTRLHSC